MGDGITISRAARRDRRAMSVELRAVGVSLSGRRILHGISAQLSEPRVGIVGRNGSGKTTLARVVAGLIEPNDGEARIGGLDMARDRRAALAAVGIIFQNPDHQIIFPTVLEEVAFGLTQQGHPRARPMPGRRRSCSGSARPIGRGPPRTACRRARSSFFA
ncbi:ATP-binding cassette domain-containing protein [Paracoccus aerius]